MEYSLFLLIWTSIGAAFFLPRHEDMVEARRRTEEEMGEKSTELGFYLAYFVVTIEALFLWPKLLIEKIVLYWTLSQR